ncbi:MAG TPA: ABC transporter ATP-binding protein [Gaiellaceae bacterium]|jgi:iron(III) transport system ATP-binding protein|nr:ABC transporter ATP-binding protein [Gaiellaceae bacterium]
MSPMIRLERACKRFGAIRAVEDAQLEVGRGEFVALLGPSGCGKTTLLRLIAGFETPDEGAVSLAGRVVAGRAWVPPERRHVGMVFQDYALFPHLTVARNVGYGLPRRARGGRVREALALVGLEGHEERFPHELSGGQQQRVALARALAPQPEVVLLDEPWSNIDPVLRSSMRDELAAILRGAGVTVLLVTHEQEEAFSLADRVALMRAGRIVQAGPPEEVYYGPASRWAAEFVGAANLLPGLLGEGLVETPVGSFTAANGDAPGKVDVLVRPELLELRPDPAGAGEVVGREFRGHDVFYRVRLQDGTTVCSQRPSTEVVSLGARVALRPHAGRVTVFH